MTNLKRDYAVDHRIYAIPFFVYYSMFGLQRVGDLVWQRGISGPRASCAAAQPGAQRCR